MAIFDLIQNICINWTFLQSYVESWPTTNHSLNNSPGPGIIQTKQQFLP